MAYEPQYTKPYIDGWKNLPEETTPIKAEVLNAMDNAFVAVEEQLEKTTAIYDEDSINLGRKDGTSVGTNSIAYGNLATASGMYSQSFGNNNAASGNYSHAEGCANEAGGEYSHVEGWSNIASGQGSHAEGKNTEATMQGAHSEGTDSKANAMYSHAEGYTTTVDANGTGGHAEGYNTLVSGTYGHAEGNGSKATGSGSHAEGQSSTASGTTSHAEGFGTTASGVVSHAEGQGAKASGMYCHAEGYSTEASGNASHAEGQGAKAVGMASHAEGISTQANGMFSHAEGSGTIAASDLQHVQGKYNVEDADGVYAHIVGGGTTSERKNIHTLDWEGNAEFAGEVKDGSGNTLSGKMSFPLDAEGNVNYGTSGQVLQTNGDGTTQWVEPSSGGSGETGTSNYEDLENKPSVNGVTLSGNKTISELGITAEEVGADKSGTAESKVSAHNTSTDSHSDIRLLIEGLQSKVNAVLDSDDETLDQMSEIVAYIKDNKELIEAITTDKVSVSDIVNNLTTNVSNKPLSAAQGVALKALIDGIVVPTKTSELINDSGFLTGYTETDPTVPSWAKSPTKPTYSKSEVGLGNVPNVTTDDQTPGFTEATERANIASGEALSVIFGKVMKWFTDLKPHAFVAPITNLLTTVAGSALDATMGKELDDKISANATAIEEVKSSLNKVDVEYTVDADIVQQYPNFYISRFGNTVIISGRAYLYNITNEFQTMIQINDSKHFPSRVHYGIWKSTSEYDGDFRVQTDGTIQLRSSNETSIEYAGWCYFNLTYYV